MRQSDFLRGLTMEYVFRILSRDPEHPLGETMLVEFGQSDARAFADAVGALTDMLRVLKTPEKVARFMRENAALARRDLLLKGK